MGDNTLSNIVFSQPPTHAAQTQLLNRIGIGGLSEIYMDKGATPIDDFLANPGIDMFCRIPKRKQTYEHLVMALEESRKKGDERETFILVAQKTSKKLLSALPVDMLKYILYTHPANYNYFPEDVKAAFEADPEFQNYYNRAWESWNTWYANRCELAKQCLEQKSLPGKGEDDSEPGIFPVQKTDEKYKMQASDLRVQECALPNDINCTSDLIDVSPLLGPSNNQYPVYYISDLHLEHHMKKRDKKDKEATAHYLEQQAWELAMSIPTYKGLVLFAGDTTQSVPTFYSFMKMFRESLRELGKSFSTEIICVLGNHELWDENSETGSLRGIDAVVNSYKQALDSITGISVLENELWLLYMGKYRITLTEQEILDASDEELTDLFSLCAQIVLGGCGFTGRNKVYNASSGLYRQTVSMEEDMERTTRFENVYRKILRCGEQRHIIILTHTPFEDWSPGDYNPNWTYVNGHTHQNFSRRDKNGLTVLSDNQIGYKTKGPLSFKQFFIRGKYNPFENYMDGIYSISQGEYRNYCDLMDSGSGTKMFDHIILIKRYGFYLFLAKEKSLYILKGGMPTKAKHDVKYYWDNIGIYGSMIKQACKPYENFLYRVAEEVQKFGGTGCIHGCIVDISYLSHIYVSPFDGYMDYYFAYSTKERLCFSSVRNLLKMDDEELSWRFGMLKEEEIPLLSMPGGQQKRLNEENPIIPSIPEYCTDKSMYDASRTMRSLQYLFDDNVIRVWNDDVFNKYKERTSLLQLPDQN